MAGFLCAASTLTLPLAAGAQVTAPQIADPGLSAEVSADATYDSNIFRTDSDRARSVDDLIVTPRLIATYARQVGNNDIALVTDLGYSYYTQNSNRSRARIEVRGDGNLRIAGSCLIEPSGRFLRQQADYGDINGPVDNFQTFSTLGIAASCPRAAGFYPFAAVERNTTRNSSSFDFADQTAVSYTGGLAYARPSLGKATAYYNYLRSDRETLGILNRVDRVGATFSRAVVSRVSIDADLHYLNARTEGAVVRPYRGLGWDSALVLRPVPALAFKARTIRKIVNDTLVPAGFAVQTNYALSLDWKASDRSSLRVSGEFGRRNFRRDPAVIFSPINSDRFTNLVAGVTRSIGRRLDLNADLRHFRRRTDSGFNDYDATLATAGVAFKF